MFVEPDIMTGCPIPLLYHTAGASNMGSTAHAKITDALKGIPSYIAFRAGHISAPAYQTWIENEGSQKVPSLTEDQLNRSARFPHDLHIFVSRALAHCRALDILPDDRYDPATIEKAFSDVFSKYNHGRNLTYIFPEESALLYAIVRIAKPRHAVFAGSYYGYWGVAAKAACRDMDTSLIDIDPVVMALASQNFANLGLDQNVSFLVDDAEAVIPSLDAIDLLVLDATGPACEEVHMDYREKAIYFPHLQAAMARLAPGALVVAHNVLLENFTGGRFWEEKKNAYRKQYVKFLALVSADFVWTVIDSTEGVLVARKR